MENATRTRWERSKTDYVKTKVDVDYMDTDGMESWSDTKSAAGSTSKTDYRNRDKSEWGQRWNKTDTTTP